MAHFSIVFRGANFPTRSSFLDVNKEWRGLQLPTRGCIDISPRPLLARSQVKMFNNNKMEVKKSSGRLVDMLDHVERRIELLREQAMALERERESLLSMLQTIVTNKDLEAISEYEREEIEVTAERLLSRTLSVEVSISTPRNEAQQQALVKVEDYISILIQRIHTDMESSQEVCKRYLNACLPDNKGPIDLQFQAAIIECTADDQKKTRKRLESLLSTIKHAGGAVLYK